MIDPKRLAQTSAGEPVRNTQVPPPPPPPRGGAGGPIVVPGYTLTREISRGGQGAVFEAVHNSTTRRVAIKIIGGGATSTAREKARFDQEAKIMAALDHPGIVRVLDRGTTPDGSMFLVMDFIVGKPLTDLLQDRSASANEEAADTLRMFLKIADAVNAAHLRGIVHRDLKPANIIIDSQREPHILDFGLARTGIARYADKDEHEPVTITGTFLGSLPWSSPEQADGQTDKIDTRTDVYALGVILYQMLTGEFPYAISGSMREILTNISQVEPMPPSKLLESREGRAMKRGIRLAIRRGKLNPTIDAIVLKALAKKREDRYQSAGELARDIGNYLAGRPTLAAGGKQSALMRPVVLIPVGIAAGVLICVLGFMAFGGGKDTNTPETPEPKQVAIAQPKELKAVTPETKPVISKIILPTTQATTRPQPVIAATAPATAPATIVATAPATVPATIAATVPATVPASVPSVTAIPQVIPPAPTFTQPAPVRTFAFTPVQPPQLQGMTPGELPTYWEPGMPLPPEPPARPAGPGGPGGPGGNQNPPQGPGQQPPLQNPPQRPTGPGGRPR